MHKTKKKRNTLQRGGGRATSSSRRYTTNKSRKLRNFNSIKNETMSIKNETMIKKANHYKEKIENSYWEGSHVVSKYISFCVYKKDERERGCLTTYVITYSHPLPMKLYHFISFFEPSAHMSIVECVCQISMSRQNVLLQQQFKFF